MLLTGELLNLDFKTSHNHIAWIENVLIYLPPNIIMVALVAKVIKKSFPIW
jgi:hypothetical protein